jgi:hypothetical protein
MKIVIYDYEIADKRRSTPMDTVLLYSIRTIDTGIGSLIV